MGGRKSSLMKRHYSIDKGPFVLSWHGTNTILLRHARANSPTPNSLRRQIQHYAGVANALECLGQHALRLHLFPTDCFSPANPPVDFHILVSFTTCTANVHQYLYGDWPTCVCFCLHLACGAGGKVAFWADTIYTRFDFDRDLHALSHGNGNFYFGTRYGS